MSGVAPRAAPDSRLGHTAGIVLCAGPHALRLGALTLAERATALLEALCVEVSVIAELRRESMDDWALVLRALEASNADQLLVLGADRPLLSPDLVIGLAGLPDADVAMPRDARGAHPTCARYRPATVAPALRTALGRGARDATELLAGLEVRWLEHEALDGLDPSGQALARVADARALDELVAEVPGAVEGAWPGHPGLGLAVRSVRSDRSVRSE